MHYSLPFTKLTTQKKATGCEGADGTTTVENVKIATVSAIELFFRESLPDLCKAYVNVHTSTVVLAVPGFLVMHRKIVGCDRRRVFTFAAKGSQAM